MNFILSIYNYQNVEYIIIRMLNIYLSLQEYVNNSTEIFVNYESVDGNILENQNISIFDNDSHKMVKEKNQIFIFKKFSN